MRTQAACARRARTAALFVIFSLVWTSPLPALAQLPLPSPGSLVVTITSPSSGSTVSGTITVTASVTIIGDLTVAGVQFKLDGANLGAEDTSAPYSVSWNTTSTSNGSHTLTAVARDLLGLQFTSDPVTVTVSNDTSPPTITITSPSSGSTVAGTITVSASASDNRGVVGVQFRLDGANLGAEDTTAPYSVAWDTTTTGNGSHTLTAVARDAAGNLATSTAVTVTVSNAAPGDTTPPTVAISSPASGATVSGTITVAASASDNVGVVGVQFQLDGVALGAEDSTAPYSVAWDTTTVANGSHTLTARARDAAGNAASAAVTVTVSNAAPAPPTRSEESAATLAPAGAWSELTSAGAGVSLSGDRAVFAGAAGATATFTFTGTGVSWIGFPCEACGIARVLIDGVPVATVDTFAATRPAASGSMFSTSGLVAGSHTLVIEVMGTQNASSGGTFIIVDAFDVTSDGGAPPPTGDTTPPTVAISSPASGATVSGTITVAASASDNVGVAGVQFQLDGVALGAEDTTAPYSVAWDTTTTGDGSHTLTAVARDAAGNRTTSAPVTVTVSNAAPAPPPATVTRFEETDLSITYTAGWAQGDTSRAWSGGTAAVSATPGAQATFTFTGTSVSWLGFRGPQTGIALVFLDGVVVAEVDTFSLTEEARVPVFTATGLANAPHTLTIEVTGRKNAGSTSTIIVVDAFDVPAPTVTRVQETDPSITYAGAWAQGDATRAWSGGTVAFSTTAGAQATFTFTGTAVTWIGLRGTNTGIARVSLDGVFVADVDTFSPTDEVQAAIFTATGLADASHTLTIEVTGLKNAASTFTAIVVDAFDVTSSGTRVQETAPSITYTAAGWIHGNRDKAYSGGTAAESFTAGAQATFTFTGTSVSWLGFRGPQTGIARVSLDGVFLAEVDTFSTTEGVQATVFRATGLADAGHTLTIEVTGLKNAASTNTWIVVDAFDVK